MISKRTGWAEAILHRNHNCSNLCAGARIQTGNAGEDAVQSEDTGMKIPLQVGSELRIKKNGELSLDNPEVELSDQISAADAVLSYRFDPKTGEHILRLLEPVADHRHVKAHRRDD
jgi:hypothetical protein